MRATEGLGVLMQLPSHPSEKDAEALLAVLAKISRPHATRHPRRRHDYQRGQRQGRHRKNHSLG